MSFGQCSAGVFLTDPDDGLADPIPDHGDPAGVVFDARKHPLDANQVELRQGILVFLAAYDLVG